MEGVDRMNILKTTEADIEKRRQGQEQRQKGGQDKYIRMSCSPSCFLSTSCLSNVDKLSTRSISFEGTSREFMMFLSPSKLRREKSQQSRKFHLLRTVSFCYCDKHLP